MISKELEATLNTALKEAKTRRHEYVSLEHLLYALLKDKNGKAAIVACGGDLERLGKSLEEFFQRPARSPAGRMGPRAATDIELSPRAAASRYSRPVGGAQGNQWRQSVDRHVPRARFVRRLSA